MKILITGSSGFIGSHLVDALKDTDNEVLKLDIDYRPDTWSIDVSDENSVRAFFKHYNFDRIYHLAARTRTSKATQDYFSTNTLGTYNIVKYSGKAKIIFTSSASVYGECRKACENQKLHPLGGYGYSKVIAETIVQYSDKPFTIFRLGTVIGEGGKCFPNVLIRSMLNKTPVEVYMNGNCTRDFVDVRDVVSLLLAVTESYHMENQVLNLGSGVSTRVGDMVELAERIGDERGLRTDIRFIPTKPDDYIAHSTLDTFLISNFRLPQYSMEESLNKIFDNEISRRV